ncbi:NAD-dependent epimerase/dehydratase family protein [Gryllotalpicola reticulitermitis]|uniref:NAD-dependent epimerase/dehydratase family protein n=1 Tax=Gryllotalpicola reticulitermitis TaxID=1184153 RepID=A0ABV8Q875_9MICO
MILVTGGSGFIGSHTVRALARLGEDCVIIQRGAAEPPAHLADLPVVAERIDVADLAALRALGARHEITGIVHLAGYPAPRGAGAGAGAGAAAVGGGLELTESVLRGFLNIVRVGQEWGVRRIGVASTIGVYGGLVHDGPLTEELPVLLSAPHAIPRVKKIGELLGEQLAEATGIEIVNLRISGTWGPVGHEDPFFAAPALIHAAAGRRPVDLSGLLATPHLGDGLDLCYVKDTGRAIALLQTAEHLVHRTYNVASGRVTTNADVIDAIHAIEPGIDLELAEGVSRAGNPLDIGRLRADTGYEPEYDTAAAVADYIAWLRAGNAR